MMNNKYMGTEQIPVTADDKTYYGCCKGCAAKLESNHKNIRYAQDPYTGEDVDKAQAYIVMKSEATKEVYYFKSEETFKQYIQSNPPQNMSVATN